MTEPVLPVVNPAVLAESGPSEAQRLAAVDAARDAVKQILTLAVAVLAASSSFAVGLQHPKGAAAGLLEASWGLMGVSIVAGALAMLGVVGLLAANTPAPHEQGEGVNTPRIRHCVAVQVVVFFLGLALVAAAGAVQLS
jgi:hypothetical protein